MISKPKEFTTPSGENVTLYYIGALADAVGRTTKCIKKWEISGVLPKTPFKDNYGRRMYSQEQIDIVAKYAEKYRITQGRSISNTGFAKSIHEDMKKLTDRYLNKK